MGKLNIRNNRVEDYTIILSTRDHRYLGQLNGIQSDSVNLTKNLNSANVMSFTLYKYDFIRPKNFLTDEVYNQYLLAKNQLWDKIVDFRFIYIKELDEYYEIKVSFTDAQETTKTITATSACEAELSQYNIDLLEVNSEDDVARTDYKETYFYNEDDTSASLLHRVLKDKAPHYTIGHVDKSLWKLKRTFSVSGTNIYDFLTGEVAEQFNCLFQFDSVKREISVYDLYTVCNQCGYREEFDHQCPKCGSTNISYFGNDTTIFVDKDTLADSITLESNADNLKNCLKLNAGDDLMTATVRLLNPNGSGYIYNLSSFQLEDMPDSIVQRLKEYDVEYDKNYTTYQGYVEDYYTLQDHLLYLEHSMMPAPTLNGEEITATSEAAKLTKDALSPAAISKLSSGTSLATVNSVLKNYAKLFVRSGYVKVEIANGATLELTKKDDGTVTSAKWKGSFIVTNYSDEEDTVTTDPLEIQITDDMKTFAEQKVLKSISSDDDEESIYSVLTIKELKAFKEALPKYSYARLEAFHDSINGVLEVLADMGCGSPDVEDETKKSVYTEQYLPYYEKLQACIEAMNNIQTNPEFTYEMDDKKYTGCIDDIEAKIEKIKSQMSEINKTLNLQNYLGEENYKIFCAYRREDTYENSNYFTDGLTNTEIIERAKQYLETANKELKKASELQFTVSAPLKNFLVIKEFEPLVKNFEVGNWIRIKIDGEVKRLRLISCSLNFGSLDTLNVEFSTLTQNEDITYDAQQLIKSAQSMASSFSYVAKQAEKGNDANSSINDWIDNGLSSANVQLKNNNNEEVTWTKHGILCRSYDEDTGEYSGEQLRITSNLLAYTDDAWKTVKTALGKHIYKYYDPNKNQMVEGEKYGLTTEFITSGHITGSTIVGGLIRSDNYKLNNPTGDYEKDKYDCTGSFIDLQNGYFSFGGKLIWDGESLKIDDTTIKSAIAKVEVTAENIKIPANNIGIGGDDKNYIQPGQIDCSKLSKTLSSHGDFNISPDRIDTSTKKIPSNKVDPSGFEIQTSQLNGDIHANSVDAEDIQGQLLSSQLESTLSNKTIVNGTLSGSVATISNGVTYTGLTTNVVIGTTILKFVNGLLVEVEESSTT